MFFRILNLSGEGQVKANPHQRSTAAELANSFELLLSATFTDSALRKSELLFQSGQLGSTQCADKPRRSIALNLIESNFER